MYFLVIEGYVYDKTTKKPLQNINTVFYIYNNQNSVTTLSGLTNAEGYFIVSTIVKEIPIIGVGYSVYCYGFRILNNNTFSNSPLILS